MGVQLMDFATLITALAGLVTAVVTFFNVRELRIARTISAAPVLVLTNKLFIADCTKQNDALFGPDGQEPSLGVMNFGNGSALEVKCTWDIDANQLVSLLNSYDPHGQYSIGFETSPFIAEETLTLYWNHFHKRQVEISLNPIVPSVQASAAQIHLSPFYLEAFHMYIRLAVHARPEKKKAFDIREFPAATLKVCYVDLAGDSHTDTYAVRLCYSHNGTHRLEGKNAYACELIAAKLA